MKRIQVILLAILVLLLALSCSEPEGERYYTITFMNLSDVGPESGITYPVREGTKLWPYDSGVRAEHVFLDAECTREATNPIIVERDMTLYILWSLV